MIDYAHFARVARTAVEAAAAPVSDAFRSKSLNATRKGDGTFVTDADIVAQQAIEAVLREATPDFGLFAEETPPASRMRAEYTWIVDPIDGTANFMHGVPLFAIQVALERDNEIVAAAMALPAENLILTAAVGQGCTSNDRVVKVSGPRVFGNGILLLESRWSEIDFKVARAFRDEVREIRTIASSGVSLAYVALGRAEMLVDWDDHPWDLAAGTLFVREAGGRITSLDGSEFQVFSPKCLASNGHVHDELVKRVGRSNAFRSMSD